MRCAGPRVRRAEVLLLLALRAGERPVDPARGLRRARGRREGPPGPPAADVGVPREGRGRARPPEDADRAVDRPRAVYLFLEVRRLADARAARWMSRTPHQH